MANRFIRKFSTAVFILAALGSAADAATSTALMTITSDKTTVLPDGSLKITATYSGNIQLMPDGSLASTAKLYQGNLLLSSTKTLTTKGPVQSITWTDNKTPCGTGYCSVTYTRYYVTSATVDFNIKAPGVPGTYSYTATHDADFFTNSISSNVLNVPVKAHDISPMLQLMLDDE